MARASSPTARSTQPTATLPAVSAHIAAPARLRRRDRQRRVRGRGALRRRGGRGRDDRDDRGRAIRRFIRPPAPNGERARRDGPRAPRWGRDAPRSFDATGPQHLLDCLRGGDQVPQLAHAKAWRELHDRPQHERRDQPRAQHQLAWRWSMRGHVGEVDRSRKQQRPAFERPQDRVTRVHRAGGKREHAKGTPGATRPSARRSRAGRGRLNRGGQRSAAAGSARSAPARTR